MICAPCEACQCARVASLGSLPPNILYTRIIWLLRRQAVPYWGILHPRFLLRSFTPSQLTAMTSNNGLICFTNCLLPVEDGGLVEKDLWIDERRGVILDAQVCVVS